MNRAVTLRVDKPSIGYQPHVLIVAAIPALLGSVLLLTFASVPRALLLQQAIVGIAAVVSALLSARYSSSSSAEYKTPWLLLGMAAVVCAPILGGASSTPHRWLGLFGFRLYVAPVVLPVFLLVWHHAWSGGRERATVAAVAVALVALGLFAQPDAAQLTAFAVASVPILWFSPWNRLAELSALGALLLAAAGAWNAPDPLAPVSYVEGVLLLAADASPWALFGTVLAAALPVTALGWLARQANSPGILAVCLYFLVLYLLAPAQVTPVPLIGFGAGPILSYFIMADYAWRRSASAGHCDVSRANVDRPVGLRKRA